MKNKPNLRFPEFNEDWQQHKLSDLVTMHARIGWQNLRTTEFLDKGDYMLITGTDFDNGHINYSTCHYVKKERYEQDKHIQIENGSILITKDGTLGKVAYVENLKKPATLNAGVYNIQIKDKNKINGKYIYQYLKAPFLMNYASQKATGGTIKHLNQNILVDFPVLLPKKPEQEKVASVLDNLDSMISTVDKELQTLQNQKKSLSKKIFNQEIRFKDEKGKDYPEWEEKKLDDLCIEITTGNSAPQNNDLFTQDKKNPFIRVADMGELNGSKTFKTVKTYLTDKGTKGLRIFPVGTVLFTKSGASLLKNQRAILTEKMYVVSHIGCLIPKEEIDNYWLYYLMNTIDFNNFATGTSLPAITLEIIKNLKAKCPCKEEQNKIALVLSKFDDAIDLKKNQLKTLKNIKKGFLQQMFPDGKEEVIEDGKTKD